MIPPGLAIVTTGTVLSTSSGTVPTVVPVVALLTVTGGLLPSVAPVPPVHVAVVPVTVQLAPGMLTLEPLLTPVQLMVTAVLALAGLGVAVQLGSGVSPVVDSGTSPEFLSPLLGSVTVMGGLLPRVFAVPVQLAVVPVTVQLAPGMLTVLPLPTPVQLMVTAVLPLAGLGLAVHMGSAGGVTPAVAAI